MLELINEKLTSLDNLALVVDTSDNNTEHLNQIRDLRNTLQTCDYECLKAHGIFSLKDRIKVHNDFYMTEIEKAETEKLFFKNFRNYSELIDCIEEPYLKNRLIEKYKFLLGTQNMAGEVVSVGSGAFPCTLLYLYFHFNPNCLVGIDHNEQLLNLGKKLFELKTDSGNSNFTKACASEYRYTASSLVYIAAFVSNKTAIVEQIVRTKQGEITILIDNPVQISELYFEPFEPTTITSNLPLAISRYRLNTLIGLQEVIKIVG